MEGFAPHGRVGGRHPVLKDLQPGQFFREQVRGVGRHPPQIGGGGCLIHDWGRQSKENLHFKHAPTYPRAKGQLWTKTRPDRSLLFMPPPPNHPSNAVADPRPIVRRRRELGRSGMTGGAELLDDDDDHDELAEPLS
jgi:hypothetical protein